MNDKLILCGECKYFNGHFCYLTLKNKTSINFCRYGIIDAAALLKGSSHLPPRFKKGVRYEK